MFNKILCCLLLVFSFTAANAQRIKSSEAFRMLQTANTLMEAQQLEAAEEYYKKSLEKARLVNDVYTEASAYQGLGTLYGRLDQTAKSVDSYKKSVKLYRSIKMNVLANVVESLLKSAQGIGDMYAGIEIGAKGVKMTVIDVKLSKDRQYDYTLKGDTSINTDAAELSYKSEKETKKALTVLWDIIKQRYQIPSGNIHIVISSGLRQELDKYEKTDYFSSIVRPAEMDSAVVITSVTPNQEAELSILGIVPQKDRYTANQLDIGSGNTKGGYFDEAHRLVPVTFPLGTKSFQRLVDSREKGDLKQFVAAAEKLWADSITFTVDTELAFKNDFKSKDVIYLSGGIIWALTSYLYPEATGQNYVELSGKDISAFRQKLVNDYNGLLNPPSLLTINDHVMQVTARNNIERVTKTYDQRALTAGAILLDELIKKVNAINPNKKFIYPRYGYVGWISGYIIKQVTHQYTGLLAVNR